MLLNLFCYGQSVPVLSIIFKLSLSRDEVPHFIQLITGLRTRIENVQIRIRPQAKKKDPGRDPVPRLIK